ncbi:MAG: glycosyltransferase [Deltaproteobacteria bacterium]|nr:glycosyltransferase [Deltaproteobacteria bacterium]
MDTKKRPRVLFISYNGLIEPLGPTQIVPYVRALAADYRMTVLSFEKAIRSPEEDAKAREEIRSSMGAHGIEWICQRYHKWPSLPATLYDISQGLYRAAREHSRDRFALVHARGYVPGAIAWGLKRWLGISYLFDIRGLQAEEYVDAGHWQSLGIRFRLTKRVEQWILHDADGLVTLTQAVRPVLRDFPGLTSRPALPPWEVIPSCVDLNHFRFQKDGRSRVRAELGVGNRPVLVYAGSVGTWYLLDEMLEFYVVARRTWPELFFLFLSNGSDTIVRAALLRHGVVEGRDAAIRWARFQEMPNYLSAADAGIAFIRPCLSKRSSSPTKYAEYLACGLPLVVNSGIGDVDSLVQDEGAGVLVQSFDQEEYRRAAEELRRHLMRKRDLFRDIAKKHFSLSNYAYHAYRRLYDRILGRPLAYNDVIPEVNA